MDKKSIDEILDNMFVVMPILNKKLFKEAKKAFKETDISVSHMSILFILEKKGTITSTEIGKKLEISKSNVTVLVDKLVEMNLVDRVSGNDRRTYSLSLTNEGKQFMKSHYEKIKKAFREKLSNFSDEDYFLLQETINNLRKIINKIE